MSYPENYKYTKEHEWVQADGAEATIGITHHAQHELGDIVFISLPKPGAHLKRGDTLGSVESVKAVSDVYAPVSGQVTTANDLLSTSPEKLNEDAHGEGWLIKIKLDSPDEINGLLSAADYEKYIGAL